MNVLQPEPLSDEQESIRQITRVKLQLSDRCDRCGAQAFTRVFTDSGELLFCKHHYEANEPAFLDRGYQVQDERDKINEKPSPANADL